MDVSVAPTAGSRREAGDGEVPRRWNLLRCSAHSKHRGSGHEFVHPAALRRFQRSGEQVWKRLTCLAWNNRTSAFQTPMAQALQCGLRATNDTDRRSNNKDNSARSWLVVSDVNLCRNIKLREQPWPEYAELRLSRENHNNPAQNAHGAVYATESNSV